MSKKSKIVLFSVFGVLVIAAVAVGISFAFFTGTDTVKNTFTMGDIEITLTEPSFDDATDGKNLVPGSVVEKDPTITETAGTSYSRIIVEIQDADGNLITNEERLNLIKKTIFYDKSYDVNNDPNTNNLEPDKQYSSSNLTSLISSNYIERMYNSTSFIFDSSRSTINKLYYNYNGSLENGDKAVLFSNLVIPTDFTYEDIQLLGTYKIVVSAEAIQTANIATSSLAFSTLDGGH